MSFSFLFSGYGRVREDDEDSDDDGSDEEIDESLVRIPFVGREGDGIERSLKESNEFPNLCRFLVFVLFRLLNS